MTKQRETRDRVLELIEALGIGEEEFQPWIIGPTL